MSRHGAPGSFRRDAGMQTGKALLVIAVVVVLGWAILLRSPAAKTSTPPSPSRSSKAVAPSTTTTTTTPPVAPQDVKLQVLNGVLVGELATQFSQMLHSKYGYDTLAPDNATAKVSSSEIYVVTPGYQSAALVLAGYLQLPSSQVDLTPPPPSTAPIPASEEAKANLVLVIGPDLASKA